MNLFYWFISLWLLCFVTSVWMYKFKYFNFSLDHIHHYYIGFWFISLGLILEFVYPDWKDSIKMIVLWTVICGIGIILIVDDALQHYHQTNKPGHTSPIHDLVQLIKWLWDK